MIRFACLCQHRIDVEDDMAGGLTQCPRCGRLNDVPTLSDLPHLAADGTYNVDAPRPQDDPLRLAELSIVYAKGTRDPQGDVIDMRMSATELDRADSADAPADDDGSDTIPLKDEPPPKPKLIKAAARAAPRYNPETGELIEQFDLKPDPERPDDPTEIPLAKATIAYASGNSARRTSPGGIGVQLLMPINVAVMGFIFLAHLVLQFTGMVTITGLWVFAVVPALIAFLIASHYGNVIDETGPQDRDELPRPLRQCELGEDLWHPFVNIACALALCFGVPVLVAMRAARMGVSPMGALGLLGAGVLVGIILLPAVMLTTNTSGTVVNLRPDRLLGLIRECGGSYGVSVGLAFLATGTYAFGMLAADVAFIRILSGVKSPLPMWVHFVGYPMLAMGIYFAHLFCWHLGLLYREHHAQFPWAYQRHVPNPNAPHRKAAVGPWGRNAKARPKKDTKTKLRELRELERKRRAEETLTDRAIKNHPNHLPLR